MLAFAFLWIPFAGGEIRDFSLGGVADSNRVRRFLMDLRDAAEAGDLAALSARVRLPFRSRKNGKLVRMYATKAALRRDLASLFTPRVLKAIREERYEELFVNYQGIMIGSGEVWFDGFDGEIKIKAVNP